VVRAGWNNFRAMVTGYEIERQGPASTEPVSSDATSSEGVSL
jgi:hypothetical protein